MKRLTLMVALFVLSACASGHEARNTRLENAARGLQGQIDAFRPLLTEKELEYAQTASDVLSAVADDGVVDWSDVHTTLDKLQPVVLARLTDELGDEEARRWVVAFRSALALVQTFSTP